MNTLPRTFVLEVHTGQVAQESTATSLATGIILLLVGLVAAVGLFAILGLKSMGL